ncbi:DUF4258 domain-containing protein [Xanthobacter sp. AM11]|uniref:DUF4258 domain-containing protein n=1 Tax=Xanthobacter sp. AM11 TaxID=3380643 RepID=UPI0039BFF44B
MSADVVPLTLTPHAALRMIREIAENTANIVVLDHAKKQCNRRGISRRQIEMCVQRGTIQEGPFLNSHGQWQVTLFRHAAGDELCCPVAIDWPNKVLVITAF